jgi:hypothetical protein
MKKIIVILIIFVTTSAYAQWQPDVRLTNSNGHSYTSYNNTWCIAANGNVVHTVWVDNRDGNYEIYYKRSTNNGINWGADIRLTNNTAYSRYPSIAVSGSTIHVLWEDEYENHIEIHYKRSTDNGINWGTDIRLTNNDTSFSRYPSFVVSGSNLHIVFTDNRDGNYEIYYKKSTDSGISWGIDTRLTNSIAGNWTSSIAVSGSVIHVVWYGWNNGDPEIYYKRSTNSGITWEPEIRLTNEPGFSLIPSIAVSGSIVHIVWIDTRDGNFEVYYKHSTDGGLTWGTDYRLTNNVADSESPSIAVSGSNVHIVWPDDRDSNFEIYYKCSTDGGKTWKADTRLTNNTANSTGPCIAISSSILHIVWSDDRDGNSDIYYKRNPTGNVGIQNISTETPSKYSLKQNYPNPFNPSTNIKYQIKENSFVTLKIFDILGKEITTLVNEKQKPGSYEVQFDARHGGSSSLPTGVYYYVLYADGVRVDVRKMVMIK